MPSNFLFSVKEGQLYHLGAPLHPDLLEQANRILAAHVIPEKTRRAYLESLLFCIASQRTSFERPLAFIRLLKESPLEGIADAEHLEAKSREAKLVNSDRFREALEFASAYDGGIERLVENFLLRPIETRRELNRVRYLAPKTASFWYLCLGGKRLMTLDVHNFRQIAGLGIEVKETHYNGKLRSKGKTKGRTVTTNPSIRGYERIEHETLELLENCDLLKDEEGSLNGALITALFWLSGANLTRGNDPRQPVLFKGCNELKFTSPYSE